MNKEQRIEYNKLKDIFVNTEDGSKKHFKSFKNLQNFINNR